jgi:hypothetical protein
MKNNDTLTFNYSEFRSMESLKYFDDKLDNVQKEILGTDKLALFKEDNNFSDEEWNIIEDIFYQ